MRKLLLLLITITTFSNVSYASFPVTENTQTEVVELIESPNYGESQPIWSILSITFTLLSLGSLSNPLAATIMALLGVVFGSIGFNKKLKGLAITGFILSLIIFLLSSFIAFTIFANGGDPTKLT
jgi:lipopolysaccharide export LptBFGC system permease protein LptF